MLFEELATGLPCSLSEGKWESIVKDVGERWLMVTQDVKGSLSILMLFQQPLFIISKFKCGLPFSETYNLWKKYKQQKRKIGTYEMVISFLNSSERVTFAFYSN